MSADAIQCGACSWPLPPEMWRPKEPFPCPRCSRTLHLAIFPAVARRAVPGRAESVTETSEASCFYHPQNRAVVPCDECGRFLCALCDLEIDGRCPGCLDAGLRARKSQTLETARTLHDSIALGLATLPAFMIWPVVFTAPLSLYYCLRHWKGPLSIVPRTRARYYLAVLFSLLEIAGVAAFIWGVAKVSR